VGCEPKFVKKWGDSNGRKNALQSLCVHAFMFIQGMRTGIAVNFKAIAGKFFIRLFIYFQPALHRGLKPPGQSRLLIVSHP